MDHTEFMFDCSINAANHNWKILSCYKDLGFALKAQQNTSLRYGSDFRSLNELKQLLGAHPLWNFFLHI